MATAREQVFVAQPVAYAGNRVIASPFQFATSEDDNLQIVSANSLAGTKTFTCDGCSGGKKVGDIGRGMGTLQFNGITATSGPINVTLVYVNGENTRTAQLSVDGGAAISLSFPFTGGWSTVGTLDVTVPARSGANTLRLFNTAGPAPDFDKIVVTVPGR